MRGAVEEIIMRKFIVLVTLIIPIAIGCATKPKSVVNNDNSSQNNSSSKSTGVVSYQYRSGGCSTVVVVDADKQHDQIILIPKDPLPSQCDKDGAKIAFNYRTLKMPNPKGCLIGIPAELSNVSKK